MRRARKGPRALGRLRKSLNATKHALSGGNTLYHCWVFLAERERERERESRAHPFQMMDGAAHPRGTGGLLPPQAPSKAKQRGRESEGTRAGREDCSRPKPQAKQSKERETERDRERERAKARGA